MTMGSSIATWLLCVWLYFSCQRLLKVTTCCRLTQCSLPFMKSESYFLCAERLKRWDSLAFYIISYTSFHSLSHSSFTLISPSVSYFCVTVPSGLVPRSSICQHHPGGVTERMRPGTHQTLDAGLGFLPPPSLSPPLFEFAGPSICLRMIWSWLSQEGKKGPPPMTNDNLRINTPEREGMRNRAESLFHHPSVSVGLLINLWSLPMTLFWCLSLIFSHSLTLVIISGNLSFCS